MAIFEYIDIIKQKITLRDWILEELKKIEAKYGMSTLDFIEKWRSEKIPEPEDHIILEEFLEWEGLSECLEKVENELKDIERRIQKAR